MSAVVEKYRKLVDRLYAKTIARAISWNYDAFDEEAFTIIAGQKVSLSRGNNSNGEPLIIITVRNGDSAVLEVFNDETIRGRDPESPEFQSYFELMTTLLDLAHRQATGADEALDQILDELDDDPPF